MAKVLPVKEPTNIERLLSSQADDFFVGAGLIDPHVTYPGDSGYFLKLMSIELYFKLIYLRETESLVFGHDLREIFDLLPKTPRQQLFESFNGGVREKLSLGDFREWLKYVSDLFVKIRYPFEEFRDMTIEEYEERVRAFEESPPDDLSHASIIYYVDRVKAILDALRQQTSDVGI